MNIATSPAICRDAEAHRIATEWLASFARAWALREHSALQALLLDDCHWRDILAMTWSLRTTSRAAQITSELLACAEQHPPAGLVLDADAYPPQFVERAGQRCVEFFARFKTPTGACLAVFRLVETDFVGAGLAGDDVVPGGESRSAYQAWTLMTALTQLAGQSSCQASAPEKLSDIQAPNWLDRRLAERAFDGNEPDVLIVGGGHAGITSAAELGRLGLKALVVDRETRIGDNWRLRYHNLKLHNRTCINHFPHMPFPDTFPDYIAKDKLANWIESYVDAMEVNFWTETTFAGASYDPVAARWTATLEFADGTARIVYPAHIIMATSVSGTPHIPEIPTIERFQGTVCHSSAFANGEDWRGRQAFVFGTGTSAHDVAQNLHMNGAQVTMVQRSPTMVLNIEPSAQLYDGLYLGDGPPLAVRDHLNSSIPFPVVKQAHQLITQQVRDIDADLLSGLEAAGFELEFGEDNSGWPLKYRQRGGGYYFNAGCSDLIVSGDIRVIQTSHIDSFTATGLRLADGEEIGAGLAVLATGYKGQDYLVESLFGADVAANVGPVWGMNQQTRELRNMWMATPQPGLWFTAGSLSQCRIYSKYLALQISARVRGMV